MPIISEISFRNKWWQTIKLKGLRLRSHQIKASKVEPEGWNYIYRLEKIIFKEPLFAAQRVQYSITPNPQHSFYTMSASSALSYVHALLCKINPIHLYSIIHKKVPTLPPITVFWTPSEDPTNHINGHIHSLDYPRLFVDHRVHLIGYRTGRVYAIRNTSNPNQVRVKIVVQVHRLGYRYMTLTMPAKLAGEVRESW